MSWRNLIWMMVVLALAALSLYLAGRREVRVQPADPAVDDLAGAIHAYKEIRRHSLPELSRDDATRGAIDGMARQVDAFSTYITPENAGHWKARVEGGLEETGLRIARVEGRLVTVGVLPGSPAHHVGLFGGMELLEIDGVAAAYWKLPDARRLLERPGKVRLRLRGFDGEVRCVLPSGRFSLPTVSGLVRYDGERWLHVVEEKPRIVYVRVSEFVEQTPDQFHACYRQLGSPAGVVLDLRGNPGGLLSAATEVIDQLLDEGLIVRVVSREGEPREHYAHGDGTFPRVPLAVLIDSRTASAAEIVAGCLQAHGRAVLVGQTSFGKWSVQSPLKLGYGLGEVHLTTAEYFLPPRKLPATQTAAGATTPATATAPAHPRGGLAPDVPVRLTVAAEEELEILRLQAIAAQPSGPLPTTLPDRRNKAENLERKILAADAPLAEAVERLRQRLRPQTLPAAATAPAEGAAEEDSP